MANFVHLHVHSHYSLLNGLTKIKALVKAAKARGFSALALTDYGSMYGAIEFYQACLGEGIKPIIGFEAFVAPRSRFDKDPTMDTALYHLILLAENYNGYKNLMKLSSLGHLEGAFNGKPRIDKELLRQYHENIIVLSGPIEGEISTLLKNGETEKAKAVALEYKEICSSNSLTAGGPDYFYFELEDHPAIPGQIEVNTAMIQLAKEINIPLVVTRDVHYLNPDDAEAQDILRCIAEGWRVDQPNRIDYRGVDRSFASTEDIAARFRHVPDAIENTGKIAERVNIQIELNKWHFAPVELPPGKTADDVLAEESHARVGLYYKEVTPQLTERLDYELNIIKTKGYSPYFLCVADFVRYAKDNGIVESTRGSAAGSLVSYVMGITTVDPMRFNLPFERFLNPFRPSAPDVDTDFADDRRDEMIEYVTKKYGADKVAQIITFGTMAARASVRDVGRALGFAYSFCDQVAKLIPQGSQGFAMTIDRALQEEPDLKKLYENNTEVKRLLDLARKVEGCARHTSIHAAGVVIAPTSLMDFSPVQYETGGTRLTTQYEMKSVEAAGVLKNDFLGIRNLAILGNAVEFVKKTTGEEIDIYNLPLDDAKVYEMLARGETMGVFQLGGSGMTRWLKELKPNRIEDIMAMVALYRPGPMESIPEYIRRKYNPDAVKFLDPRLEKILGASYGLLVYQDDVMLTAIELAGYDWMEADKFRKAMGKKIPEEMAKQKEQFYKGCQEIGKVKKDIVDEIWHAIEPFAAYGFNKAHAASYGIVAYQTAYMKAHFPVQFMTAILQAEASDLDKVAAIVHECGRMGIEVLPPDVNESFKSFAMVSKPFDMAQGKPGRIRFGLNAIKNVGEHICEVMYRERKERGPYSSLENFLERIQDKDLNKKSLESLAMAGALDCFGFDRNLLLSNSENILFFYKQARDRELTKQDSLFAASGINLDSKVTLKPAPNATIEQKLTWEKDLLGLYLSAHPLHPFVDALKGVVTQLSDIDSAPRDSWVVCFGVVESIKKKITKKGDVMLFVVIQDLSATMELLVFPKTYTRTKDLWVERMPVCIVGKTPREDGDNKIFVENAYELRRETASDLARQLALSSGQKINSGPGNADPARPEEKYIRIILSSDELQTMTEPIKTILAAHPGDTTVYLQVGTGTIKVGTKVNTNESLLSTLTNLFGKDKIQIIGI